MGRVGSYRELRVYRQAFDRAMDLKGIVAGFPNDERFDLARQLRRSSRSVCANLAEAWRRRMYPASFAAKIVDAEAEASETRVHLEFAEACGYTSPAEVARLGAAYDAILAQLVVMRSHPERWRPLPKRESTTPTTPHRSREMGSRPATGDRQTRKRRSNQTGKEEGHSEPEPRPEPPSGSRTEASAAPEAGAPEEPLSPPGTPRAPRDRNPAPDRPPAPTPDPHVGRPPPPTQPGPRT